MVVNDGRTLTNAVPDLLGSWVLVAVTVMLAAEDGAVKTPLAFIAPALADQVTEELYLPEPFTAAVHCEVAFSAIVEGAHAGETEAMVEGIEPG
jgi:hypothetical protein